MREIVGCIRAQGPAEYKLLNWAKITPDKDGVIYWHVANFTEKMDKFKILFAFQTCFEKWQQAFDAIAPVGRVITLKSTDDWHQGQIRLYFLQPGQTSQDITISDGSTITVSNRWPFDGPQGVLAHRPPNSFDLYFDEGEAWSDIHKYDKAGNTLFVQLWQVAMHELGHMLDIDHATDPLALMYPTYDGEHTEITQDDLNGLAAAFGKVKADLKASMSPAMLVSDRKVIDISKSLPHGATPYRKRQLDQIEQIVVHHSADNGTPESIAGYHVNEKKWPGVGYHFLIDKSGQIYKGNNLDVVSYNVANQNTKTVGICCIGNYEEDTPSAATVESLKWLIGTVKAIIGDKPVIGHRDVGQTLCPGANLYKLIQSKDVS
jgi:hypothetical protein